ncbi:uncharacterized protein LOC132192628 [Neocloeon triangulifer]|uniref:uncharacterized protein LOC132192628 n=1 Tax=Neocloeon triangulifer TaxID=2078957 RepID=UPI00286F907F|nr:uncharacterized protein LOC132192628 [Neocloeon triangulifer]
MQTCLIALLLIAAASAASTASKADNGLADLMVSLARGCGPQADGAPDCLRALSRSLSLNLDKWRAKDVHLGDYVVLAAAPDASRTPRTFNLSGGGTTSDYLNMITEFLASRTLQVRFPKELVPANIEEARGKLKKMGGTLLAGLMMMKGTLGALAFGALALIAGKALLLSVLALTLALISALKKVSSGHHSDHRRSGRRADEESNEWIGSATVASEHKGGVAATAHYLAYRNQQPYEFNKS